MTIGEFTEQLSGITNPEMSRPTDTLFSVTRSSKEDKLSKEGNNPDSAITGKKIKKKKQRSWLTLAYLANFDDINEIKSVSQSASGEIYIDNIADTDVVLLIPNLVFDVFNCPGSSTNCKMGPHLGMILDFTHNSFYGGYAGGWAMRFGKFEVGLSYGRRRNVTHLAFDPVSNDARAVEEDLTGTMITFGVAID